MLTLIANNVYQTKPHLLPIISLHFYPSDLHLSSLSSPTPKTALRSLNARQLLQLIIPNSTTATMEEPPGGATAKVLVHVEIPFSQVNTFLEWLRTHPANAAITAIHPGTHSSVGPDLAVPPEDSPQESANRTSTVTEASLAKVRAVYDALKNYRDVKALAWSKAEMLLKRLIEESTDDLRFRQEACDIIDDALEQVEDDWYILWDCVDHRESRLMSANMATNMTGGTRATMIRLQINAFRLCLRLICNLVGVAELARLKYGRLRPSQPDINSLLGINPKIYTYVREILEVVVAVESVPDGTRSDLDTNMSTILETLVYNGALMSQVNLVENEYNSLKDYAATMVRKAFLKWSVP